MTPSRTTWISLAALCVIVASLAWLGLLRSPYAPSGASTYSRSAIGHAGILELLRMRGVQADPSEGASGAKVHHGGLLVVAEPGQLTDPTELRLLLAAPRVLLVLPKWGGLADSSRPGWIAAAARLPLSAGNSVMDDAFPDDFGTHGLINIETPKAWSRNALRASPKFDAPVQLLTGDSFDAVVAGPSGLLVGERRDGGNIVTVLTDPDIISNHGLAEGNAAFALALIDRARAGGPVLFDETIHGFRTVPKNKLLAVFSRPFAPATMAALFAAGLLAWADGKRFGAPLPRPGGLPAGQLALIATVAGLLDRGGHQKSVLARYVRGAVQDVAADLDRTRIEGPARLADAERRRGVSLRAADLLREAAEIESVRRPPADAMSALALRAYTWKQEMMNGRAGNPRDL